MFKNVFLEIEYDGTSYFGWQVQNKKSPVTGYKSQVKKTIQGELQKALRILFNKKIKVVYAGRTDTGVHAKGQCVNFKIETKIPLKNIKAAVNSFLPLDISIKKIKKVPLDFHARFNVKSKVYRYIIYNKKRPCVFNRNHAWYLPDKIDLAKVKKAIPKIAGQRDFSCFVKEARRYESCIRQIKAISVRKRGGFLYIDIEADGFLRNMVRNIVSLLVRIGRDKVSLKNVNKIIKKELPYANKPAPSCGLYLYKVNYE